MSRINSKTKRLTLFENPVLEKLTIISAGWFIACWSVLLPLIALAGWGAVTPLGGVGLFLAGVAVWTLFEYAAHRFVFHWITDWPPARELVYVIHGNHHEQPRDLLRNLMPPIVSVSVGLVVWGLLYALFGAPGTWILLGFMTGYVAYDFTHYACHQWPMKSRLGRALQRHHMGHHFTDNNGNYAITAIFWDQVFGTKLKGRVSAAQCDLPHSPMEPAE